MIIGITGAKFSGKDTAAEALVQRNFMKLRMADPLKEMLRTMYRIAGVPEKSIERKLEGDLKEEPCDYLCGKTPRHAMQTLGHDWRNMIGEELWTRIWHGRAELLAQEGIPIVCTDIRYPHEAEAVRSLGGRVVRITRPGTGEGDNHASETEMKKIEVDATLMNTGTVEDLHHSVQSYLREITQ